MGEAGREGGWKWMVLQPPENSGLSEPPVMDSRYLPEIHSLLLPNIVHDSNDLQCQHILTKVWTKKQKKNTRLDIAELALKSELTWWHSNLLSEPWYEIA